jgi:hypothetical protein
MPRYGRFGKHIELFDLWSDFNEDPAVREAFADVDDDLLAEADGTGAPEGRADFPIFLQTVIRHRFRERFRAMASRWQSYMGEQTAQDFREHTSSQLNGIRGIKPVKEDGEYKRMRSSEEPGPSYAVAKHGGTYGITMELIVDDDADQILNRTPREMGRAMSEYVSQVAVAYFESNPTYSVDASPFLASARGNERTGSTAQPNETNLMSVLDEMQLRRDSDGIPFTVNANRILVRTPSQKATFDRIIRSQLTGVTDTAAANTARGFDFFATGTYNPAYNVLPPDAVVTDPWLNDPNDWWVFGDAQDRPAFFIAYLRNMREPFIGIKDETVRSAMGAGRDPYNFNIDIIEFKIRHVFGLGVGEPLAVYRNRPS